MASRGKTILQLVLKNNSSETINSNSLNSDVNTVVKDNAFPPKDVDVKSQDTAGKQRK